MKTTERTRKRRKRNDRAKYRPVMPKPNNEAGRKSKSFELRLIEDADSRYKAVKVMRERLEELIADAAIDSVQKKWLAARGVFLVGYLESLELNALEGGSIDFGSYTQAVNALSGLLKSLGLDKQFSKAIDDLDTYVSNRNGRHR